MIGIYGGTFDPIHFGHLNLAIDMMEARHLDEVWFCPVWISPHKSKSKPTPVEHRLEMLRLAIEDISKCSILDIETKRQGPSYTIDTLEEIFAEEAKKSTIRQFCLMLGDDAIPSFCRWHEPEKIVQQVPIFVGRRTHIPIDFSKLSGSQAVIAALERGMTETKLLEISGTDIRKRIASGLYCGHLVPEKVLDYIYKHKLYL